MRSIGTTLVLISLFSVGAARAIGSIPNYDLEQRMFQLVNQDRVTRGLPALQYDAELATVARRHSQDMVTHGYFAHRSPRTGDHADRIRKAGIAWSSCAENLAMDRSIESAQKHLMQSPGHRRNLLARDYTHIGIGIIRSGGNVYVTQNFIRPRGARTASSGGSRVRSGSRRSTGGLTTAANVLWNLLR